MSGYRVFVYDGERRLSRAFDLDCDNDQDAVEVAARHVRHAVELWHHARCVKRFDADLRWARA